MPRSNFLKNFAAALAVALTALAAAHAGLERLARWAETKPGTYLWRSEDQLLLLSPAKFARAGDRRVMIFGASETAEGFSDKVISRLMPGYFVENLAFDGATFNDLLVQLRYLETVYGPQAIPSDIVVGISQRYVANILIPRTRLFRDAVNQYSPATASSSGASTRVTPKPPLRAALAWLKFRIHQTERYRYAVEALGIEVGLVLRPEWARKTDLSDSLMKAKFQARIRGTDDEIKNRLAGIPHWQKTHIWLASEHRDLIESEMGAVNDFARRHHVRLYYVNMPLLPVNRTMFAPGVYDDYMRVVQGAAGDAELIDLGELLQTPEFSDAVHATSGGAARISTAAGEFIRQHDLEAQAAR